MRLIIVTKFLILSSLLSALNAIYQPNDLKIKEDNNSYYFTKIDKDLFKVTGSDELVQYKCSYGGEPLAIWSNKIDELIDSSLDLKPTYVKEGFKASNLIIDSVSKSKRVERDGIHFIDENLPKGSIYYELTREIPFFVSTANFPVFLSEFSKKTVANFHIHTDNTKFSGNNPAQQYSFVISNGFFIYENTTLLFGRSFAWDQAIDWSNVFASNKQDLYMRTVPRLVQGKYYEGFGFWICGGEEKKEIIEEVSKKRGFVHLDKQFPITKKEILTLLMHDFEIPELSETMNKISNLK